MADRTYTLEEFRDITRRGIDNALHLAQEVQTYYSAGDASFDSSVEEGKALITLRELHYVIDGLTALVTSTTTARVLSNLITEKWLPSNALRGEELAELKALLEFVMPAPRDPFAGSSMGAFDAFDGHDSHRYA